MSFSLYDVSIPVFIRNLKVLEQLLQKAQAHAAGNDASLVESRLVADMKPLPFQVQVTCNTAKFQAVRVGGVKDVPVEDNEKTLPELLQRVAATITFLEAVKPDSMDGKEDKEIKTMVRKGVEAPLNGKEYTFEFAIPNFFFHLGMTYALLRKEGVDVGKKDWLGNDL
jgi:uncharacterized protein